MNMLTGLVVAAAVIGVTAASEEQRERGVGLSSAHEQLVDLASMSCNKKCSVCSTSMEHKNEYGGDTHEGAPHGCAITSLECGSLHGCGATFSGGPTRIEFLASEASVERILELVPERNSVVVPERGVIQLLADCGTVIAQVPIAGRRATAAGEE